MARLLALWACALATLFTSVAAEEPGRSVVFDDPLGQVEVGLPPIAGELDQTSRELAPKLTKELRFVSKSGPAAVLVSTRIRADLPKDDRVLERVAPRYANFKQEHSADDVVLEFRGESPHRTLEFALAGGEYSEAFPFVIGGEIGRDDPPKSVTISQFFVASDRMFELALYLPNDDKSAKGDLLTRARKTADTWRATIAVKK